MSKRRCTALDTLLTFCPPAPCARTAVKLTSSGATLRSLHLVVAAAAAELADHEQQNQRADHRADPSCRLAHLVQPERLAEETGDERPGDAQQHRHDPAHLLVARHDESRDRADDQADDEGADESHGSPSAVACTRW